MGRRDWTTLATMSHEARQSPRYAIEAAVELRHAGVVASGRTDNVSDGGMCVIVDREIGRGAEVVASLALVFDEDTFSEPLELPARVVWSTSIGDSYQLGTSFLGLSADQKSYLDMFLRYLEEGLSANEDDDGEDDTPKDPFAT
jgi:hypothetical protein